MAPQRLEMIESAPGNGMGSEASDPQDLVRRRAADVRLRLTSHEDDNAELQLTTAFVCRFQNPDIFFLRI